jgi:hypothetical protein
VVCLGAEHLAVGLRRGRQPRTIARAIQNESAQELAGGGSDVTNVEVIDQEENGGFGGLTRCGITRDLRPRCYCGAPSRALLGQEGVLFAGTIPGGQITRNKPSASKVAHPPWPTEEPTPGTEPLASGPRKGHKPWTDGSCPAERARRTRNDKRPPVVDREAFVVAISTSVRRGT